MKNTIRNFVRKFEQFVTKGEQVVPLRYMTKAQRENLYKRSKELHPSSFPFCPLAYAHEFGTRPPDEDLAMVETFGSSYYLSAGHVFHESLQRWLGNSLHLIGDWKCKHEDCGHIHPCQTMPPKCQECGHPYTLYQELGGQYGRRIHWHTDGVWVDPDTGLFYVIDFKSTSMRLIEHHRKQGLFPYSTNRFQIEAYIPMVEENYKIKIAGWMLIYAPRDNPNYASNLVIVGDETDEERKEELKRRIDLADKGFIIARKINTPKQEQVLNWVYNNKLCEDNSFYQENIHDKWNPCPLAGVCFNGKKKTKTFIMKRIAECQNT